MFTLWNNINYIMGSHSLIFRFISFESLPLHESYFVLTQIESSQKGYVPVLNPYILFRMLIKVFNELYISFDLLKPDTLFELIYEQLLL